MQTNNYNFVFTGSFTFPEGMAGTKRIYNLIQSLEKKQIESQILLISNKRSNSKFEKTKYFRLINNKSKIHLILSAIIFIPNIIWYLNTLKKSDKKNILYVYSGINIENVILVLFAKLFKYEIIVDIVEDFTKNEEKVSRWRGIKIKTINFLERRISYYADYIVVISKYLEKKFEKITHSKTPMFTLPVSSLSNLPLEDEEVNYNNILYSGSYGYKDGLEYIIQAFSQINKINPNLCLVLTGKTPEKILKLLNIQNINYKSTGYLSDEEYFKTLRLCGTLLMTRVKSDYANAGFPFKLGEYLATGNAVIATKVSDIEIYLEHNVNAYLIEPNESNYIKEAILFLAKNKNKAISIGNNGKLAHQKYFNSDTISDNFISFLKNHSMD